MQTGLTLEALAERVEQNERDKRDFLVPSRALKLKHVEDGSAQAALVEVDGIGRFRGTPIFHGQLAGKLNIPKQYYDRMLLEKPQLLAENVNAWLKDDANGRTERTHLVRTMGVNARAILSDRYRPLDYYDTLQTVLPVARDLELTLQSANLTDTRLYLQFAYGGLEHRLSPKLNDIVQAGTSLSNSEVGMGGMNVNRLLWYLVCLNGMISSRITRKTHVGRSLSSGDMLDTAAAFYAEDTRRLDDAAFFAKVRDAVKDTFTREAFDVEVAKIEAANSDEVTVDPVKVIDVTAKSLDLNDDERGEALTQFIRAGNMSRWGLANAVTALAHKAQSYDRAVELEALGGKVVALPKNDWSGLLAAARKISRAA